MYVLQIFFKNGLKVSKIMPLALGLLLLFTFFTAVVPLNSVSAQTQYVVASPGYINLGLSTNITVTAPAVGSYNVVVQKPSGLEVTLTDTFTSAGQTKSAAAPYVTEIPHGYRDWQWISSAHEAGDLNSLGAILGNNVAIKAYREGKLPFPDGTIIAALHYRNVPSEENNKSSARINLSFPAPPRIFSLWSKTREGTPRPVAGASQLSRTVNLPTRLL